MCVRHFNNYEYQSKKLLEDNLIRPAYDYVLKCSHLFNLMLARGCISTNQRLIYISRIRKLSKMCAKKFLKYGHSNE